jgi:hypothetical protein
MTVHHDDVPLADQADLAEQQREVDEAPTPEPGDALPEPLPAADRADAAEADVLEQSQPVTGDEDEYPFGASATGEAGRT